MKLLRNFLASKVAILSCLSFGLPCSLVPLSYAGPNPVLWDTSTRFSDTVTIDDRAAWKIVPGDLLSLEANPPKASSDPGYYGREYVFKGDAVIESEHLLAVFWAAKGCVVIYSKPQAADSAALTSSDSNALTRVFEILPLPTKSGPLTIGRVEIIRNGSDQVVLQVAFGEAPNVSAVLAFGDDEIVDVKPSAALTG